MKEIVRVIRKSMLSVEESVPWELVQDSWATRRCVAATQHAHVQGLSWRTSQLLKPCKKQVLQSLGLGVYDPALSN